MKKLFIVLFMGLLPSTLWANSFNCSAKLADKKSQNLITQSNQLIVDTKSKKMWTNCRFISSTTTKCEDEGSKISWFDLEIELNTVNQLGLYGFKDWRLPTANELLSLVGEKCYVVNQYERRFSFGIPAAYYWIDKPYVLDSKIGYDVRNNHVYTIIGYYPHMKRYVHLVRDL